MIDSDINKSEFFELRFAKCVDTSTRQYLFVALSVESRGYTNSGMTR